MPKSNYKGSATTKKMVAAQIKKRWGKGEAAKYDPYQNALTFRQWSMAGYRVKKGEKALKSITYVKQEDEDGEVVSTYPKTVNLFYIKQVEKVST